MSAFWRGMSRSAGAIGLLVLAVVFWFDAVTRLDRFPSAAHPHVIGCCTILDALFQTRRPVEWLRTVELALACGLALAAAVISAKAWHRPRSSVGMASSSAIADGETEPRDSWDWKTLVGLFVAPVCDVIWVAVSNGSPALRWAGNAYEWSMTVHFVLVLLSAYWIVRTFGVRVHRLADWPVVVCAAAAGAIAFYAFAIGMLGTFSEGI